MMHVCRPAWHFSTFATLGLAFVAATFPASSSYAENKRSMGYDSSRQNAAKNPSVGPSLNYGKQYNKSNRTARDGVGGPNDNANANAETPTPVVPIQKINVSSQGNLELLLSNAEQDAAGNEALKINQNALTDEQIAEKCQASIAKRVDMVTYTDAAGVSKNAPRCVQIYETMRDTAGVYIARQEQAVNEVQNSPTECNNQQNCVNTGSSLLGVARNSHQELGQIADEGVSKLSGIVSRAKEKSNNPSESADKSNEQRGLFGPNG